MATSTDNLFVARCADGRFWAVNQYSTIELTAREDDALQFTHGVADDGRVHVRAGVHGWLTVGRDGRAVIVSDENVSEAPHLRLVLANRGAFGFVGAEGQRLYVQNNSKQENSFHFVDFRTHKRHVFQAPKRFAAWSLYESVGKIKFTPMAKLGTYAITTHHESMWSLTGAATVASHQGNKLDDALKHPSTHFELWLTPEFKLAMRSVETKMWVCAEPNGVVVVNRPACCEWEQFSIALDLRGDYVGLLTHHNKFLCANAPGHSGGVVTGDRRWLAEWERFRFIHIRTPLDFRVFGIPTTLIPSGQVQVESMTLKQIDLSLRTILGSTTPFALVPCDNNGVPHLNAIAKQPSILHTKKATSKKPVSTHLLLIMGDLAGAINARKPAHESIPSAPCFEQYEDDEPEGHVDPVEDDLDKSRNSSQGSDGWNLIDDE